MTLGEKLTEWLSDKKYCPKCSEELPSDCDGTCPNCKCNIEEYEKQLQEEACTTKGQIRRMSEDIDTIKNCVVFFTVVFSIALVIALIAYFITAKSLK